MGVDPHGQYGQRIYFEAPVVFRAVSGYIYGVSGGLESVARAKNLHHFIISDFLIPTTKRGREQKAGNPRDTHEGIGTTPPSPPLPPPHPLDANEHLAFPLSFFPSHQQKCKKKTTHQHCLL